MNNVSFINLPLRIFAILLLALSLALFQFLPLTYAQQLGNRMFQGAKTQQILSIERLADIQHVNLGEFMNNTDNSVLFSELNWNSDGTSIIFESRGIGAVNALWMISSDGKEVKQIDFPFDRFSDVFGYKISPNDEFLFSAIARGQSGEGQGPTNLYKFSMVDSKLTRITDQSDNHFVGAYDWMPEGKVIYETKEFNPTNSKDSSATRGETSILWVANSDGQKARMLLNETEAQFGFYDASPDGKILGLHQNHLALFDPNTGTVTEIKFAGKTEGGAQEIANYPKWSSNGEYLVYWEIEPPQYGEGNSSDRGGRAVGNLTLRIASSDGNTDDSVFEKQLFPQGGQMAPVGIDPDGRYIVYEISYLPQTSYDNDIQEAGIYLVDLGTVRIPEFPTSLTMSADSVVLPASAAVGMGLTLALLAMHRKRAS